MCKLQWLLCEVNDYAKMEETIACTNASMYRRHPLSLKKGDIDIFIVRKKRGTCSVCTVQWFLWFFKSRPSRNDSKTRVAIII